MIYIYDGETFSTLPAIIGKEFVLSTRVAEELFYSSVVGKYEQIHIFVSYSKVSQFDSKVPDSSLLQRGRGTSSGKACRQRGPVGYCNHTIFHTFFTIFDLQGAYPTSYLLAIFNLFWPGLNLLGKCFLCLSTF